MIETDKLFIKIISTDRELEQYSYLPLRHNFIYIAKKIDSDYYNVFLEGDEGPFHTVYKRHIEVIALNEMREQKLKKLGI